MTPEGASPPVQQPRSTPPSAATRSQRLDALERAIIGRCRAPVGAGPADADAAADEEFQLGELEPEDDESRELVVYDMPFD
jgi:hypothetical protein